MGAWGPLFDENDDAADWLADFADAPSWGSVDAALDLGGDYVDAPEASNALAASEVVAAAKGNPSPRLPSEIREWAVGHSVEGKVRAEKAAKALTRVRDDSELSDLWEDSDQFVDWKKSVDETIARL